MDGASLEHLLARIDAALARIEAAAARLPTADPGLAQRHARLRGVVADAIGELDALISGQPGEAQP
jgi:hypothetical protein